MKPLVFYFAACFLLTLSIILVRRTSPYSDSGGTEYERKQMRRLAGTILFVIAALSAVVGWICQTAYTLP